MTQEVLAERNYLSTDTIRRLEHGSFSPSLKTLRKLCIGLDLLLSTLFESFEFGARNESRPTSSTASDQELARIVAADRSGLGQMIRELEQPTNRDRGYCSCTP